MAITQDPRKLAAPAEATLLEQVQYFRCLRDTRLEAAAHAFRERTAHAELVDWGRMALEADFGTLAAPFIENGVAAEVAEAKALFAAIHRRPLADGEVVAALNHGAERCLTTDGPRVVSWGTWAAAAQRHIAHRIVAEDHYIYEVLGQPGERAPAIAAMDAKWSDLVLYPLVNARRWRHGELRVETFRGSLRRGVPFFAKRPELLTAHLWAAFADAVKELERRRAMPAGNSWLATPVPSGTALDAGRRVQLLSPGGEKMAIVDALRQLDPWTYRLAWRGIVMRTFRPVPPEELKEVLGPRVEYDVRAMRWLSSALPLDSPELAPLLHERCRLDADECGETASTFIAAKRDGEAAAALQRALEAGGDAVQFANLSRFLVRYLHEHGKRDEAMHAATVAAETFASEGLNTKGLLLEWRGQFAEAESYFGEIRRQYDHSNELLGFYYRRKEAQTAGYAAKYDALASRLVPDLARLDPSTLTNPPQGGVLVDDPMPRARLLGLEENDVIVGLDGWRVRRTMDYTVVREFDWRPDITLHVWRRGRYFDVTGRGPSRMLGFQYRTYPHH
jgi:hypothetical protein